MLLVAALVVSSALAHSCNIVWSTVFLWFLRSLA